MPPRQASVWAVRIAVAISWSLHKSILWATIQGFFGWFYVLYYALTRPGGLAG